MASSQVEIASSTQFGYVLQDRNRHDRFRTRDSNSFQKNFQDLVQTHLNSCISGHSRNSSSGFIDYTDLWVHHPETLNNQNDIYSQNSGDTRLSESNENSHHHIDNTDLWVHTPQINNNKNNLKKTKAAEKWDKARDLVLASERKTQEALTGAVSASQKLKDRDGASASPALTSRRGKPPDNPSSRPVSNSQGGKIHGGTSVGPVSTSRRGRIKEGASSGNVVTPKMERSPDGSSSGPASTSQSGRIQEGASSGAVVAAKRERSPDGSSSGPVSTSQRGRNWEVISSRLFPLSQTEKSQEGMSSDHDLRYEREHSPEKSESSVEVPSLHVVASLVQKWRDFQAAGKSLRAINSSDTTSRCNSVSFHTDNESFDDGPSRSSDACEECLDLRPATLTKNEELFPGWESDQTGLSGPPSTRGRDSDATEKERIRVADIIKKLTSNGEYHMDREPTVNHELPPHPRTSLDRSEQRSFSSVCSSPRVRGRQAFNEYHMDREPTVNHELPPHPRTSLDKSDQRSFSSVCSSPRVRGRQAFNELLMQMEHDRHNELERLVNSKTVSKFAYKGRIQAMLRVKLLRRGNDEKDGRRTVSESSESSRLAQSAIVYRRQKFNEGPQGEEMVVDKAPQGKKLSLIYQQTKENHQQGLTEKAKPLNVLDNNLVAEKSIKADPVVGVNHRETNTMVQQNGTPEQGSEIFHQETDSSSDVLQQGTKSESSSHNMQEFTVKETSVKNTGRNELLELEESNKNQHIGSGNEFINVIAKAQADDMEEQEDVHHNLVESGKAQVDDIEEEEDTHPNLVDSDFSQETDVSHPFSGWGEQQECFEQEVQSNQDWIADVSRPRSTWEDLRQARYQEMLDPFMENDDIRQLLQRKSVSAFLSSGLRDSIDRLMMSRTQQPPNLSVSKIKIEESMDQVEEGEEQTKCEEEKEKEQRGDHSADYEKGEEDEIQSEQESNESPGYVSEATSWDFNQDQGISGNYFRPALRVSPQQYQPSSSYTNHPSIEMEFIYEMRGNMERLHQEVSELKRSVEICINSQVKLRKSISQDGISASFHSGRKKRRDSTLSKKSRKGRCYICYEMQIDTLLYRCGHMCTCFKCAQDLQWSSGKCPICEAPIIDVVRAYAFS